jgi:periplasmic protein TonB
MKPKLFLRILFLIVSIGFLNIQHSAAQDNKIYPTSTVLPSFFSGKNGLAAFLKTNVRYPAAADSAKVTGTVTISFIVEKTGALSGLNVVNSIGHGCDEEALRVVRKMPKWNPGTIANKPVRVLYKVLIKFPQ